MIEMDHLCFIPYFLHRYYHVLRFILIFFVLISLSIHSFVRNLVHYLPLDFHLAIQWIGQCEKDVTNRFDRVHVSTLYFSK